MLLSTSHNFIFVHVPKTAGSSMHNALKPFALQDRRSLWSSLKRRLPVTEKPGEAHFRIHDSALIIRNKLSRQVYVSFLSFAVVRNPFSHAVSHFRYMSQYRSDKIARRFDGMSFRDYLAYRSERRKFGDRLFVRLPDQSHFLVDETGALMIDRILRFESLDDDFQALALDLKLGDVQLEKHNLTKSRRGGPGYKTHYDAETEELVRRIYARDFRLFGYPDTLGN